MALAARAGCVLGSSTSPTLKTLRGMVSSSPSLVDVALDLILPSNDTCKFMSAGGLDICSIQIWNTGFPASSYSSLSAPSICSRVRQLVGAWEQPAISSPSLLAPSFRARVLEVVGALERSGSLCTASKIHALGAAAGLHYLSSNNEKRAEGLANFNGSLSTPSKIHALGAAAGLRYLSSNNVSKAGASPNFNGSLSTPSKIHALGAAAGLRYLSSNNVRKAGASPNFNGSDQAPENGGDPMEKVRRQLMKLVSMLKNSKLVTVARILKDWWGHFSALVFTVTACWTLQINPYEGFQIIMIILLEKRKQIHLKLKAYKNAIRKNPGDHDDAGAVATISFSVIDLVSQEIYQKILLVKGIDLAILREMIEMLSMVQPLLPSVQECPPTAWSRLPLLRTRCWSSSCRSHVQRKCCRVVSGLNRHRHMLPSLGLLGHMPGSTSPSIPRTRC